MAHIQKKVWDELLAEFPVLWNPRELLFRDRHATDQTMLQLLKKCNSMSKIPFTYKSLRRKLESFHRRRKYQAKKAAKRASSADVTQSDSWLSDQGASSDSTEPVAKIQSIPKNPNQQTGPFIDSTEPTNQTQQVTLKKPEQQTGLFTIVFHCCGVCGEVKGECLKGTDKSYIVNNKTTLAMNDLRTEIDFDKDTTVCQNCDIKLKEMYEFIKLVKSAQDKMNVNIESRDNQMPIDVDDDSDENVVQKVITTSLTITDTELVKPTVLQKRKCEETPEVKKKFKVTIDLNFSDDIINDDRSTMDDIEAKYQMFKKGDGSLAKSADDVSKAATENNEDAILKLKKIIEQDMHKGVNEPGEVTDSDRRSDIQSELTSDRKDENSEDISLAVKKDIDADDILNEVNETGEIVTDDDKRNDGGTDRTCEKTNATASKGESVCGMHKSDLIKLIMSIVGQMLKK